MNYSLCYVEKPWLYFTKYTVAEQTGDDWDDAPYQHNAGRPYNRKGDRVRKIAVDFTETRLRTPREFHRDKDYSVDDINSKRIPWLKERPTSFDEDVECIYSGASMADVVSTLRRLGASVYYKNGELP